MPEKKEYDNRNRVSVWVRDRKVGEATGEIGDMKVYGYVIPTLRERGPKYEAFLNNKEGTFLVRIGLFHDDKFDGLKASGGVDAGEYGSYWVSMWTVKSDNDKAPQLNLTFKERENKERNPEKPKPTAFDADAVSGGDLAPVDDPDADDLPF